MRTCPKCGRQLRHDAAFCDACGECMPAGETSSDCGDEVGQNTAVYEESGKPAAKEDEPSASAGKEKGSGKRAFLLGGIGAIALAATILAVLFFFRGSSQYKNFTFYLKDDELFFTDFSKNGTLVLSENLLSEASFKDIYGVDLDDLGYYVGNYVGVTKSGERMFYPDRCKNGMETFTLYCRESGKEDAVRIDSDIKAYVVDEEAAHLLYLKGDEDALYYSDLTNSYFIAENVASFYISEDGRKVFFLYDTGEGYFWYPDKDSVKAATGIEAEGIFYATVDLSAVYYLAKDGTLLKISAQAHTEIASGVKDVIAVFDSGEVYYTRLLEEEICFYDYVLDDDPTAKRDALRNALINSRHTVEKLALYCLSGAEETMITDALCNYFFPASKPILILSIYNQDVPELRLSRLQYFYEAKTAILEALNSSVMSYICVGTSLTPVPQSVYLYNAFIPDGEDAIYFFDGDTEQSNLYRAAIEDGMVKTPKLYDTDCTPFSTYYLENGSICALKYEDFLDDVDSYWWEGDLYIDKKKVDGSVRFGRIANTGSKLYYIADWSPLGGGTLIRKR